MYEIYKLAYTFCALLYKPRARFGSLELCLLLHKEKIQQDTTMYQNFIIPYLFETQHVSGDTPPIIRSLNLHWQPLVFHTWKVVRRVDVVLCQSQARCACDWQSLPSTRLTTFHVWKTRGCQCSFRLLIMGGVSPETCWASYKYEYISICWILLYELYYDARINEHQDYTFSNHTVVGVSR